MVNKIPVNSSVPVNKRMNEYKTKGGYCCRQHGIVWSIFQFLIRGYYAIDQRIDVLPTRRNMIRNWCSIFTIMFTYKATLFSPSHFGETGIIDHNLLKPY